MQSILDNTDHKEANVYIYIPTIKYNNHLGSLNIEKHIFDNLIKQLLKKLGKYSKASEIIYQNENLTYKIINKKDRHIVQTIPINTIYNNKCLISIVKEKSLDDEQFPVINKYTNICKRNKMIFPFNNINISLITESHNNENSNYFVELHFVNNTTVNHADINEITKYIMSYMF